MDDLVEQLSSNLNLPPDQAQMAVGAVLRMIRKQSPDDAFERIKQVFPAADDWMALAPEAGEGVANPMEGVDKDSINNEDAGVRAAAQVEHWDPTGGMGKLFAEVFEAFPNAHPEGGHASALAELIHHVKSLGLDSRCAAEAGPPVCGAIHEQLGDQGFVELTQQIPILPFLAQGGTGTFTDHIRERIKALF